MKRLLAASIFAMSRKTPIHTAILMAALFVGGFASAQDTAPAPDPTPAPSPAPPPAAPPPPNPPPANQNADPKALPQVEITGQRNATTERRNSSASKIIIDRETIEQYGDSNLGDVLRRMPGVTQGGRPGRGGDIRMRGMGGGFTQILIDGERIPPGFSVEQITPEQVERIEILRAPTAETGARAIAGTINIILREPLRKLSDDIKAAVQFERGRASPNGSWSHTGVLGENGTYTFNVNAGRTDQLTDTRTATTYTNLADDALLLTRDNFNRAFARNDNLVIGSRLQWRLGAGEQISLQPFLVRNWNEGSGASTQTQTVFDATQIAPEESAPYATAQSRYDTRVNVSRVNMQLNKRLGEETRLELRGGIGRFALKGDSATEQFDAAGAPVLTQTTRTDTQDKSWSLTGKLSRTLEGTHSLVAGWEFENVDRTESPLTILNGAPQLAEFGGSYTVSTRRTALYAQDEWDISPQWSAYAGLRGERIQTRSDATQGIAAAPVRNTSTVVTPLAHTVWRFSGPDGGKGRDQIRLSLTQSYRSPTVQNLVSRPSLSTLFPVPGPNTSTSPDRAGNPNLKPELANGIDLAYENYLKSGGVVSVSVFSRRIKDLIRNVTALESVSWADVPRWVTRPQNFSRALTRGIEMDAKFQLSELIDATPPVNFKLNLSVFDSKVDAVPGPYNRIDQQPRATGNFGADYRFRGTPWTLGGNLAWTPAYSTQLTDVQTQRLNTRRVFDAFAVYAIDANTRVRLSLSNLAAVDSVSASTFITDTQNQTAVTTGRTDTTATIRLEMKL